VVLPAQSEAVLYGGLYGQTAEAGLMPACSGTPLTTSVTPIDAVSLPNGPDGGSDARGGGDATADSPADAALDQNTKDGAPSPDGALDGMADGPATDGPEGGG
jgi:hypothetical protein